MLAYMSVRTRRPLHEMHQSIEEKCGTGKRHVPITASLETPKTLSNDQPDAIFTRKTQIKNPSTIGHFKFHKIANVSGGLPLSLAIRLREKILPQKYTRQVVLKCRKFDMNVKKPDKFADCQKTLQIFKHKLPFMAAFSHLCFWYFKKLCI